ncbi:MAG TPA: hypothetical protein VGV18_09970 [Verrucomicrobiae bacterium]|nr:hypothetical protein [Verrucomicrobiae bacterium]
MAIAHLGEQNAACPLGMEPVPAKRGSCQAEDIARKGPSLNEESPPKRAMA